MRKCNSVLLFLLSLLRRGNQAFTAALCLFIVTVAPYSFGSENNWHLDIYTEDYPPFNYIENGVEKGISVDLIKVILNDLNRPDLGNDIMFVPWGRGLRLTQKNPNSVLFSTARNPEREALFQWVGPILENKVVILGKKKLVEQHGGKLTANDLRKLRIVVIRDDIGELVLDQTKELKGIEKEVVSYPEHAARLLEKDRVDLWCYGITALQAIMHREGYDSSNYQVHYTMEGIVSLYYALNKETPTDIVKSLQDSLNEAKRPDENGISEFDRILESYGIKPDRMTTF